MGEDSREKITEYFKWKVGWLVMDDDLVLVIRWNCSSDRKKLLNTSNEKLYY
jgi:hypothetical protein